MPFVLDASAAIACLVPEESDNPAVGPIQSRLEDEDAVVPTVFLLEVLHFLVKAERRTRGKRGQLEAQLELFQTMPIQTDTETATHLVPHSLVLDRTHRLSIFDATYLELALRRSLPLASFDNALIRVAEAEGVTLVS